LRSGGFANSDPKPQGKHQKKPPEGPEIASFCMIRPLKALPQRQADYGTTFSATIRKRQPKIVTLRKNKIARTNQCLMFNPLMTVTSFLDYL
jgi:hypothetical protein